MAVLISLWFCSCLLASSGVGCACSVVGLHVPALRWAAGRPGSVSREAQPLEASPRCQRALSSIRDYPLPSHLRHWGPQESGTE